MKKFILSTLLVLANLFLLAQGGNMGGGDWNDCGLGTWYDSGGSAGGYSSNELITETYCSDVVGDCIQFTFNSFDTEACCDDLTIYDGTSTSAPLIGTYAGTALNGITITSSSGCLTMVFDSDGSVQNSGWDASYTCVTCPVPTCSDGIQNQGETGVDCGGPCPACPPIMGNGDWNNCGPGTFYDSGDSGGDYSDSELITETYCSDVVGDCIQFTFNSFSTEACCDDLTIYDGTSTSDPVIGTYAGTALNGVTITSSSGCLTMVFDSDGSITSAGWDASFSCVTCPTCSDGIQNGSETGVDCGGPNCPTCPCGSLPIINDEACCATSLTVNPDLLCGTTTSGTVANATASFNANTCFGNADDDVWFSFTATQTNHEIDLSNVSGSVTDMYHSVYEGPCNNLSAVINCSDANSSSLSGLTIGNTYYIRVYTYTSVGGQNTTFDICVGSPPPVGPCGNPANNDYCSDPATLVNDGGTWSSTTSGIYTGDTPANVNSVFCGSIENNSWYSFVATSTTESFNFTSIFNCNNGWGIQAEVYDVTTDANGCCTNFSSVSNCWNPNNTTPATVTATGLTIGNTYYLMIDGQAGDDCDFTVNGWSASGILPVTLIDFSGYPYQNYNKIIWTTESEVNNDYFIIQKSLDAKNFINIGTVKGNGNTSSVSNYSFLDEEDPSYTTYYRLKQVDYNGESELSDIIYINRLDELGVFLYPNPSKGRLNIDITKNNIGTEKIIISYTSVIGKQSIEIINLNDGKNTYQSSKFDNLSNGIYFVQVRTENGDLIKTEKLIKE